MAKTVVELQDAFQSIVNYLIKNKKVLAIFTFGSIVSGDIWEGSDIDLFVVYNSNYPKIRDIYSESKKVPVHTKLLDKEHFIKIYEAEREKGYIRELLIKSKLVFSRDEEISNIYNTARYSLNNNIEKWNLVYLGRVLKDVGVCKKYIANGKVETAYELLIKTLDSFSKLLMNLNGYLVTKDSFAMACNLNNEFKLIVNNLFQDKVNINEIIITVNYINKFLDENIDIAAKSLTDYLKNKNEFVSSYEIKLEKDFEGFNIKIENILKELNSRGLILKDKRILKDFDGISIIKENVYASKIIKR
ncbi:MAG: nucleotidyltransferase domain-containing protein [Clostridium sp.]|nr:nucleotidyltransferase domain-containing protein [Clostridium sp.]